MSEKETILTINNLTVGYGSKKSGKVVFSGITAQAKRGELVALMGRNGTGKSTLLRCITRMLEPIEGSMELEGQPLLRFSRKELARKIAWVSTEPVRVQHLRVADLVALGRYPWTGWMGGMSPADREMVFMAMDSVGITGLASREIHELSDGERQRVMIARSLAQDAEMIVLDEPTAYLDLVNRYEMIHLLLELSRQKGKCIIFSTHDWQMATSEADLIWLMDDEGWASGAPEDLGIQQRFDRLIASGTMKYDPRTGQVKLLREEQFRVALEGDEEAVFWTRRALERTGCRVVKENADRLVRATGKGNSCQWEYRYKDKTHYPASIYELLRLTETLA